MRHIDPTAGNTCSPVKHPNRDFQKSVRPAAGEIAPKHRIAGLVDQVVDKNRLARPRVPWIKHLAPVGNMGVLAFSCTTPNALILPLSTKRRRRHIGAVETRNWRHET